MTAVAQHEWLDSLPVQDGFHCISEGRRFAHDEEKYDAQYASDPANMQVGSGLVKLLEEVAADFSGPALEVGCGTGLLSLGLAAATPYPLTILTDPSPAFLRITRQKIRHAGISEDRLRYAILQGEEIGRLPAGSVSLIVLRSTLHHVLDVDAFIADAGRAIRPGGALTFEEPCLEGYVLMGALAQFLPALAQGAGRPLSAEQARHVELFVRSMAFYSRRDLDKSKAEDKHLFRVDEIMATGAANGLEFEFKANRTYESFLEPPAVEPAFFHRFMRDYVKYCMSWPDDLLARFDEHMPPYCSYLAEASRGGSGPYLHGVFVARKRA